MKSRCACRYGDKFVVYLLPDDEDPEAQADGKEKIVLQVGPLAAPSSISTHHFDCMLSGVSLVHAV